MGTTVDRASLALYLIEALLAILVVCMLYSLHNGVLIGHHAFSEH